MQWLLLAAFVVVWVWKNNKRAHPVLLRLAVGAPLLVILWSLVFPWVALQLNGVMGASLMLRVAGQAQDYAACGGRRILWSNVLQMLARHPWQGWGLGETDFAHSRTGSQGVPFGIWVKTRTICPCLWAWVLVFHLRLRAVYLQCIGYIKSLGC